MRHGTARHGTPCSYHPDERCTLLAIEQTGLDLLLAVACAAGPWLARPLRSWLLAIGLAGGIVLSIVGAVVSLPIYPWSNFVVLLVAVTGGLLVGRGLPPRFRPFLSLLLILSVLDVGQIALTGGLVAAQPGPMPAHPVPSPAGPMLYGNFLLLLPVGHYLLGIGDLLVITAAAEHWRRRGGSYLIALMPGVVGFALVRGAVWLTHRGGWPLIPFLTVGWLCSEGLYRFLRRHPAVASKAAR
jgi:hypothetical protein